MVGDRGEELGWWRGGRLWVHVIVGDGECDDCAWFRWWETMGNKMSVVSSRDGIMDLSGIYRIWGEKEVAGWMWVGLMRTGVDDGGGG